MTNQRRKNRWRNKRAAHQAALYRVLSGRTPSPVSLPSYEDCHPLDWVPDIDNARLQQAAAGRLSIGYPHRPPAPISFAPPGRVSC